MALSLQGLCCGPADGAGAAKKQDGALRHGVSLAWHPWIARCPALSESQARRLLQARCSQPEVGSMGSWCVGLSEEDLA
jgi:hypothetical protein